MGAGCPMCLGQYDRIDLSLNACKFHESYFVIVCSICGKTRFSDNASMCMKCSGTVAPQGGTGYSKDHRFYLRLIGQEGSPISGL